MSEKPEECACCGHETERLHRIEPDHVERTVHKVTEAYWLCDLCYGSVGTDTLQHAGNVSGNTLLLSIRQMLNIVIDEVRGKRLEGEEEAKR